MAVAPHVVLDHVACGVADANAIGAILELGLGAKPHRGGPGAGFRGAQWSFDGDARLELIEPSGEAGGFLHRFLERSGPGVHHVTFKVPDISLARDRAVSLGYDVIGFRDDTPSWKECFLHPRQAGGIVVRMASADPDADDGNWLPFGRVSAGQPERRAALRGLQLVTRDGAASRRLWCELLDARAEVVGEGGTTYRWADSPLELRVRVDAQAPLEGPLGLLFGPFEGEFPPRLRELVGTPLLRD